MQRKSRVNLHPKWGSHVQCLCALQIINPEYANIEIVDTAPPQVLEFTNMVFGNMSIGDHPDVIGAEKQSRADIAGARKGDVDCDRVILDAVMLTGGTLLNRDRNDVMGKKGILRLC